MSQVAVGYKWNNLQMTKKNDIHIGRGVFILKERLQGWAEITFPGSVKMR